MLAPPASLKGFTVMLEGLAAALNGDGAQRSMIEVEGGGQEPTTYQSNSGEGL